MDNQYLPHSNIVRTKIKLFAGNSLSMKGATDCGSEVSRSDQQPNIINYHQINCKYCGGKACDFHRLGTQRCPSIHDQSDELLAAVDMWLALFTMQAAFRRDLHFENGQFVLIFEKQGGGGVGGSNSKPNLNLKLITVVRI